MATPNGNGTNGHVGKVVQIIGPVVDVEFGEKYLPPIYQALRITSDGFEVPDPIDVIAEVQQHLGEGRVRAVSVAFMPRTMPSVGSIDTARTRPSPRCCCTSAITSIGSGTSKPSEV